MEGFLLFILIILVLILMFRGSVKDQMTSEFIVINRRLEKIYKELQDLKEKVNYLPPISQKTIVESAKEKDVPIKAETVNIIEESAPKPEYTPKVEKKNTFPSLNITEEVKQELNSIQEEVRRTPIPIMEPSESWWEKFTKENPDIEKFIGENLIAKIAIVILVLGISFFVKYAIDKNWINEVARVAIGIIAGLLLLGVSQYLHREYKAFSSILVAGAITVFYFTIGYGFHVYQLYSQTTAFIIMVIITLFSSLVSLYYDRQELAVLSTVGGFAVPFMVSTGDGNYIILFSYLLILNLGLFLLSFFKNWDIVKIVAFIFTYIIYLAWYFGKYAAISLGAHNNALLFVSLFYILYLIINVLDVLRNRPIQIEFKIGFLFLNTFIVYLISMEILHNFYPNLKGLYTLGMALINLALSFIVYKKSENQNSVIYLLLAMTLLLATIAIPIQFKGFYITIFWAGEAFLLLWLSSKMRQSYLTAASIIVYALSAFSLFMDWGKYNSGFEYAIILNSIFLTGIIVCITLYLAYFICRRQEIALPFGLEEKLNSHVFLIAAILLTYLVGHFEVVYQANQYLSVSQNTPSLVYHFIITTLAIIVISRMRGKILLLALILGTINMAIFLLYTAYLPFNEMVNNIYTHEISHLNFMANFVYLSCILLSLFCFKVIYDKSTEFFILNKGQLIALFLIFILFLFSQQLLMYILKYYASKFTMDLYGYQDYKTQLYKVLFPIVWGTLSLVYLAYGIKYKIRIVRIVSLCLILLTVVKLFIYDINSVSEGGKILAFILLGVLMLIMAFMYQKIKILITDDQNPPSDE